MSTDERTSGEPTTGEPTTVAPTAAAPTTGQQTRQEQAPGERPPAVAAGGDARLGSPRTDAETERRRVVEREKEQFAGMRFWTAFFGWLTATGLTVLLIAVVSAVAALVGVQNFLTPAGAQAAGIASAVVLLVILLVAYYCGGYVAGRMARFSGLKQGLAVWLWAVLIAVVLGIVGAIAGTQANIAGQLSSIPTLPFSQATLTAAGIITALAVLVVTLVGAVLGGLGGMRFHRKVDRAGIAG
jgi:VIT1/CCC1 family predicted Fe2+/Mn2+ transporter